MNKQVLASEDQAAVKVLDYWSILEFLEQESYDECTKEKDTINKLREFKKNHNSGNVPKNVGVFETLSHDQDIYSVINNHADSCEMGTWGNLTFYIGRIKRQICIMKLADSLGKDLNLSQAENNDEYIPILSFQCTPEGVYINHTLSLSPVLWALSRVSGSSSRVSEQLTEKDYSADLSKLEKKFFGEELDNVCETETVDQTAKDNRPSFKENSITTEKLIEIHNDLLRRYERFVERGSIEEKNGLKFRLFLNSVLRDNYEDLYKAVNRDFYSSDLKMVKSFIEEKKSGFDSGMLPSLKAYICAPYNDQITRSRQDFINVEPKEEDTFYERMSEILNISNAPLGKWPCGYMPALMQQVAINLCTPVGKEEGNEKIFSVNGPPGTGKTTLLREVIASNIVEKAKLLSQYEKPDDAFKGNRFKKGKLNGIYSKYYPNWYEFIDKRIEEYGVLVASSNNTAVENITKDLPLRKSIANDLFFVDKTDREITLHKSDKRCPDVYYTDFARRYFGKDQAESDAWGMITAPLGNRNNINGYYYSFLNPVLTELMQKNDYLSDRVPYYQKTREDFKSQLKKVESMQMQLSEYGNLVLRAHRVKRKYELIEKQNKKRIEELTASLTELDNLLRTERTIINKAEQEYSGLQNENRQVLESIEKCEQDAKRFSAEEQRCYKEITLRQPLHTEKLIDVILRFIFGKGILEGRYREIDEFRVKAAEYRKIADEAAATVENKKSVKKSLLEKIESVIKQLEQSKSREREYSKKRARLTDEIQKLDSETKQYKQEADIARQEQDRALVEYDNKGQVLDISFIKSVLSEDNAVSTKAHVTNPWTTIEYDQEREKLFFLALQLTKEFVLSSRACRNNLNIIGQYWGYIPDTDQRRIVFDQEDSEAMMGSLLNTLFLLTPVLSSTFASIARLLKDVKKPGVIGTLIIDEAGQATPQMAVGALFRSQKAIIVGDPKQVEPIVKDDLKLLKDAFDDPLYGNYKDKSLSVQRCADLINPVGTYFDNGTDYPEWVGCPLVVHRRCISPMYDISNTISYNGIMKQQTAQPKQELVKGFIDYTSKWIDRPGIESGNKNHYVPEQGRLVCEMVEKAFEQSGGTDLYIITPFKTVLEGICDAIRLFARENKTTALGKYKELNEWLKDNIGTVHKFQGKEASEVIFVLGCDKSIKKGYAVNGFVNSNIVNVAATRAKYRLYIIGDREVWKNNKYVNKAREIIEQ